MALINKNLGARILASIGRRGEQPDVRPARIVGQPFPMRDERGRVGTYAEIIEIRKNTAGEEYLAQRTHNLAFAFDRFDRVPRLDGTDDQPKTWQELVREQQAEFMAFAAGLPASDAALDVADLMAADVEPQAIPGE